MTESTGVSHNMSDPDLQPHETIETTSPPSHFPLFQNCLCGLLPSSVATAILQLPLHLLISAVTLSPQFK